MITLHETILDYIAIDPDSETVLGETDVKVEFTIDWNPVTKAGSITVLSASEKTPDPLAVQIGDPFYDWAVDLFESREQQFVQRALDDFSQAGIDIFGTIIPDTMIGTPIAIPCILF